MATKATLKKSLKRETRFPAVGKLMLPACTLVALRLEFWCMQRSRLCLDPSLDSLTNDSMRRVFLDALLMFLYKSMSLLISLQASSFFFPSTH